MAASLLDSYVKPVTVCVSRTDDDVCIGDSPGVLVFIVLVGDVGYLSCCNIREPHGIQVIAAIEREPAHFFHYSIECD